jgi:hypothetical protein
VWLCVSVCTGVVIPIYRILVPTWRVLYSARPLVRCCLYSVFVPAPSAVISIRPEGIVSLGPGTIFQLRSGTVGNLGVIQMESADVLLSDGEVTRRGRIDVVSCKVYWGRSSIGGGVSVVNSVVIMSDLGVRTLNGDDSVLHIASASTLVWEQGDWEVDGTVLMDGRLVNIGDTPRSLLGTGTLVTTTPLVFPSTFTVGPAATLVLNSTSATATHPAVLFIEGTVSLNGGSALIGNGTVSDSRTREFVASELVRAVFLFFF